MEAKAVAARVAEAAAAAADSTSTSTESVLLDVLLRDRALFLEKWGRYVDATALAYFKDAEDDYEVRFHADRVRARLRAGAGPSPTTVRNRRYEAMQRLLREGEYFSMEAMQARQPALYSEFIGQYERDDEEDEGVEDEDEDEDADADAEGEEFDEGAERARGDDDRSQAQSIAQRRVAPSSEPRLRPAAGMERHRNEKLSELVLRRYDQARLQRLAAGGDGDGFEEEFDTDDEEARAAAAKRRRGNAAAAAARMAVGRGDPSGPPLRAADLADLRDEYVALMQHRFLAGNDTDFDYREVDQNEDLDDVDQAQADTSDRYFDDEEPGAAPALDDD